MNKYRQYKFAKQVKKLLNSPAPGPEIYDAESLDNLRVGSSTADRSRSKSPAERYRDISGAISPDQSLRISQIKVLAEMMNELCVRFDRFRHQISGIDFATLRSSERENVQVGGSGTGDEDGLRDHVLGIQILLQELKTGLVFTEAEKEAKRTEQAVSLPLPSQLSESASRISAATLSEIQKKVLDFRTELNQRQRAVAKVERTVKDLGVNVNDARCSAILRDQRTAETRLAKCLDEIVRFFRREFEGILRIQGQPDDASG